MGWSLFLILVPAPTTSPSTPSLKAAIAYASFLLQAAAGSDAKDTTSSSKATSLQPYRHASTPAPSRSAPMPLPNKRRPHPLPLPIIVQSHELAAASSIVLTRHGRRRQSEPLSFFTFECRLFSTIHHPKPPWPPSLFSASFPSKDFHGRTSSLSLSSITIVVRSTSFPLRHPIHHHPWPSGHHLPHCPSPTSAVPLAVDHHGHHLPHLHALEPPPPTTTESPAKLSRSSSTATYRHLPDRCLLLIISTSPMATARLLSHSKIPSPSFLPFCFFYHPERSELDFPPWLRCLRHPQATCMLSHPALQTSMWEKESEKSKSSSAISMIKAPIISIVQSS